MKDDGAQRRCEQSHNCGDRRLRRHARVLGNPIFGVLVLSQGKLKMPEIRVRQPVIDQVPG
jgi:hypothetical protein